MAAFITIAVGRDPECAEPVFVSDDPAIIGAAVDALLERLDRVRVEGGSGSFS